MGAGHTNLYAIHSRTWRDNRYVYPVLSRRSRGLSIGVNVNPGKECNFGCVYCCVDRSIPAPLRHVDLRLLGEELDQLLDLALHGELFQHPPFDSTPAELRRVNDVAFSGDGEPTSYLRFGDACRVAAESLEKQGAGDGRVKIVLITNATLLHRPGVQEALRYLDQHHGEIWAKLDAGTERYFKAIEQTKVEFSRVLANIRDAGRVRPIVIQSMFVKLRGRGPDQEEIDAYLKRLEELRQQGCQIARVQVYTLARPTPVPEVAALEDEGVDFIVNHVKRLGLPAAGFYRTG